MLFCDLSEEPHDKPKCVTLSIGDVCVCGLLDKDKPLWTQRNKMMMMMQGTSAQSCLDVRLAVGCLENMNCNLQGERGTYLYPHEY